MQLSSISLAISRLAGGGSASYSVNKSLRFRSSASAYLGRTPSVTGSQTTWTWSGWFKRGALGFEQHFFAGGTNGLGGWNRTYFGILPSDKLFFGNQAANFRVTTQVFRDPSAWYHLIAVFDSSNATDADRIRIYINGTQVTAFDTNASVPINTASAINSTTTHQIGWAVGGGAALFFDGEMAEVNFVDGQALAPTAFGAFSTYNQWLPKKYVGTYGTNGFYLPFTNTTSTSTLVADSSGNGNNWTPNNISLTAGSTYDSLTDVPTLTSTTVANYAVLNPNANKFGVTIADVNLTTTYYPASAGGPSSTIGVSSGKWYFEFSPTVNISVAAAMGVGIVNTPWLASGGWYDVGNQAYVYYWNASTIGGGYFNGAYTEYSKPLTTSDIGGVAFDLTASTVSFYKNNVLVVTVSIPSGQTWFATSGSGSSAAQSYGAYHNFGQQPFTYTPPTGFLPLNTYNI